MTQVDHTREKKKTAIKPSKCAEFMLNRYGIRNRAMRTILRLRTQGICKHSSAAITARNDEWPRQTLNLAQSTKTKWNRALQVSIFEIGKWMGRNPIPQINHYEIFEEHNFPVMCIMAWVLVSTTSPLSRLMTKPGGNKLIIGMPSDEKTCHDEDFNQPYLLKLGHVKY